jgi:hypothetical protein
MHYLFVLKVFASVCNYVYIDEIVNFRNYTHVYRPVCGINVKLRTLKISNRDGGELTLRSHYHREREFILT